MDKEICICAAVVASDGKIYRGHRHGDCFETIIRRKLTVQTGFLMQGFITSQNRYVDREEGARLQKEAGILSVWTGKEVGHHLFSEDLY